MAGWLESMGLRPGRQWATLAGLSEFGGGALIALGLGGPLGPLASIGSMGMAIAKVHRDKPVWVTSGGGELPITNIAIATALMLAGYGTYSLDERLGVRVPRWVIAPGLAAIAAGIALGTLAGQQDEAQPETPAEQDEVAAALLEPEADTRLAEVGGVVS
jgi:putative oxidoreductase